MAMLEYSSNAGCCQNPRSNTKEMLLVAMSYLPIDTLIFLGIFAALGEDDDRYTCGIGFADSASHASLLDVGDDRAVAVMCTPSPGKDLVITDTECLDRKDLLHLDMREFFGRGSKRGGHLGSG
jgi:hypothetical protein